MEVQELNGLKGTVDDYTRSYIVPDSFSRRHLIAAGRTKVSESLRRLNRMVTRMVDQNGVDLNALANDQMHDQGVFVCEDGSWLKAYIASHPFQEVLAEVMAGDGTDKKDWDVKLAGRMFEDIAYAWLAQTTDQAVLLSPSGTAGLMQALYPKGRRIDNGFGLNGIKTRRGGISIPDGVLITNDEANAPGIIAEVEYRMTPTPDKIQKKYDSFLLRKAQLPHVYSPSASYMMVVPSDSEGQATDLGKSIGRNGLSTLAVPLSKAEIGYLVNRVLSLTSSI